MYFLPAYQLVGILATLIEDTMNFFLSVSVGMNCPLG